MNKQKKTKFKGIGGELFGTCSLQYLILTAVNILINSYKYVLIAYHVTGFIPDGECIMTS